MSAGVVGGGIGTVILVVVALLLGVDPRAILDQSEPAPAASAPAAQGSDESADFASVVLGYTEDVWSSLFAEQGMQYRPPTLVLFSGAVRSACGMAEAAVGPFYCPRDEKLYLDLDFLDELQRRLGAPGDFARAYVIAHEVGHHVQNLLGLLNEGEAGAASGATGASVRDELQADCLAGVWAYQAERGRHVLEPGDLDEALNAAAAVGDDRLQRRSQGYVVPESFTHGTATQRSGWFRRGFESGRVDRCDTSASIQP